MTLKEKVREVCPDYITDNSYGGVDGCPDDYEFLHDPANFSNCGSSCAMTCEQCWNREFVPAPPKTGSDITTPESNINVTVKQSNNAVDHPAHYQGTHECIDEMIALFGVEAVKDFCRCNVYKYRYRADRKNGEEDIKKADWYMTKLMELEEINNEQSN